MSLDCHYINTKNCDIPDKKVHENSPLKGATQSGTFTASHLAKHNTMPADAIHATIMEEHIPSRSSSLGSEDGLDLPAHNVLSPSDKYLKSRSDFSLGTPRSKFKRRILRFRDDIDTMRDMVKGSYTNIKNKISPPRDSLDGQRRNIKVEYLRSSKKDLNEAMYDEDVFSGVPDRNFSPSLVMDYLKDGKFVAEISLASFPPGDIMIKIINTTLVIYMHPTRNQKDSKHSISRPYRYGDLDLPMYVDPCTLEFTLQDDVLLTIEGLTKGLHNRRLSISTDDLRVPRARKQNESPIVRRKYSPTEDSKAFDWMSKETAPRKPYLDRLKGTSYRSRSNTT